MKNVLFVCVENSCRSQIAEAFARIHGEDVIRAYSSGSEPSGTVNPRAIAVMEEIGYDMSAHRSKSPAEIPRIEYDHVITMGCGDECPSVKARHREDWDVPDPGDMDIEGFRNVRKLIEEKVEELIFRLKSE